MRPGDLPEFERWDDNLCEHSKQHGQPSERNSDHIDSYWGILHWISFKPVDEQHEHNHELYDYYKQLNVQSL